MVESPPDEENPLNENSVRKLKQIAETYFHTISDVGMYSGAKDLKAITSLLEAGCKRNHIRCVLYLTIIIFSLKLFLFHILRHSISSFREQYIF